MNTVFGVFTVLKDYVTKTKELTITAYAPRVCLNTCKVWVAENAGGFVSFTCIQRTPTLFEIFGYNGEYQQIEQTSFDFADVDTPPDLQFVPEN